MELVFETVPTGVSLHGLLYRSRMRGGLRPEDIARLVGPARQHNAQTGITSVLMARDGTFLQWLEGPGDAVMALLRRIAADPRHEQLEVLRQGPLPQRHHEGCPLALIAPRGQVCMVCALVSGVPDPHASTDLCAERIAHETCPAQIDAPALVEPRAISRSEVVRRNLPGATGRKNGALLPSGAENLSLRAVVAGDMLDVLAQGWLSDIWSGAEVSLALARLQVLWTRAGRMPEPVHARDAVAIVVPEAIGELVGALIKTDLLRDAGISVRLVLGETAGHGGIGVDLPDGLTGVIIAGPRVGHMGGTRAAQALQAAVARQNPALPVHLGGRAAGPFETWLTGLGLLPPAPSMKACAEEALARMALARIRAFPPSQAQTA